MVRRVIFDIDGVRADPAEIGCVAAEFKEIAAGFKISDVLFGHPYAAKHLMQQQFGSEESGPLIMTDLKFWDAKESLVRRVRRFHSSAYITVNAASSEQALKRAANEVGPEKLVAVTIPTDMSTENCIALFGEPPSVMVPRLAKYAASCGINTIVCSGKEAARVRQQKETGEMTIITPGIVPHWAQRWAFQSENERACTPTEAIMAGATYLVIGSAISKAPNQHHAFNAINKEVVAALARSGQL